MCVFVEDDVYTWRVECVVAAAAAPLRQQQFFFSCCCCLASYLLEAIGKERQSLTKRCRGTVTLLLVRYFYFLKITLCIVRQNNNFKKGFTIYK